VLTFLHLVDQVRPQSVSKHRHSKMKNNEPKFDLQNQHVDFSGGKVGGGFDEREKQSKRGSESVLVSVCEDVGRTLRLIFVVPHEKNLFSAD
jgi:hypothetical protein